MSEPFYSFKRYLTDTYGEPLYRVPIDPGLSCPHRNPDGSGGCAFCPPDGSRAQQIVGGLRDPREQILAGIAFARSRYGARRFMAYLQAFTATHASPARQRRLYETILDTHPFDALSVGTRPDCLPPGALDLMEEMRSRLDVWVELGVQTVNDTTLARIRRGHDWACSRRAIRNLKARGVRVAVHVILGLPGEEREDFRLTAETVAREPIDGIKIHNLHVVRGTALADEYARRPFPVPDAATYAGILIDFLRRIPPRIPVMRINTDTPPGDLVAPRWDISKPHFRDLVKQRMQESHAMQGDLFGPAGV